MTGGEWSGKVVIHYWCRARAGAFARARDSRGGAPTSVDLISARRSATVPYELAAPSDLDQTAKELKALGCSRSSGSRRRDRMQCAPSSSRSWTRSAGSTLCCTNAGVFSVAANRDAVAADLAGRARREPHRSVEHGAGLPARHESGAERRQHRDDQLDRRRTGPAAVPALRGE